jgi:hypothetical protein
MKKTKILNMINILGSAAFVLALFGVGYVFAVDVTPPCTTVFCGGGLREGLDKSKPQIQGKGISTSDSLTTVILGLIEFSLPFAGLFAFVGLIYGGFLYITAFATDQSKKAKDILIWSGLGLVMIFLAYPFVATLIKFRS